MFRVEERPVVAAGIIDDNGGEGLAGGGLAAFESPAEHVVSLLVVDGPLAAGARR